MDPKLKKTGETQRDEHAVIANVSGKKVFVIDNAGNQITTFGFATVTALLPQVSFYQNLSLVSGFNFYGYATPGSNPTATVFRLLRETILTGQVLFGNATSGFLHQWSSTSLASITYL